MTRTADHTDQELQMTEHHTAGPAIYRDGNRLVSPECGGFVDTVPDEQLQQYADDDQLHDLDRAFAAAVIAVRRLERLTNAARLARLTRPR